MHRVRAEIVEIRGRLNAVASLVRQVHAPVQAAPDRPTPQQTIDILTPAVALEHLVCRSAGSRVNSINPYATEVD
jgi:hypothetical protein